MQCSYFDAGRCRSCSLMGRPYDDQLAGKQRHCEQLLPAGVEWLPPVVSQESGYRNKAKMVVAGTVEHPTLGILDADGRGVDLRGCGVTAADLRATFDVLAAFVTRAHLTPYDVPTRRGELKYLLLTGSPDGELMLRFVLRSQEPVTRLRKHLPWLRAALPRLQVVSVNLQPEHKAVLEGPREIVLTEAAALRMRVGDVDLHLRPQSFFQTNTAVAAALYRQAAEWVGEVDPATVWDLYCGVGGFALHLADGRRDVVGIETSREAVASAEAARDAAGLTSVRFLAGDATTFALSAGEAPDLVVVNPPRRGVGPDLAAWLESSDARHVVYSSCNAASLARDLAAMPSLAVRRARVLDMFPQTDHYEVIVMLERVGADGHHTAAGAPAERDTPVGAWGVRSRGRPSLVLEPDGAVHGSDGCNRLAGSWSSGPDGAVVLGPLASTRMACDGVDTWLSGAAAARVVTGRLEVRDAAGRVLGSLGRDQSAAAAEISST